MTTAITDVVVHLTSRPEGMAALRWTLEHITTSAEAPARVRVVTSGEDRQGSSGYFSPGVRGDVEDLLAAAGVTYDIRDGGEYPAQHVVDLAAETGADCIITGVPRRSRTMKFVAGSHTQQILAQAECPVVGVKAPATD